MDYKKTKKLYIDYVDKCRNTIKSTIYNIEDLENINVKTNDQTIDEIIKKHRLKMIDIKLDHTMRMIEQILKINEKLGINIDLCLVTQIAILYHDIGRMRQSTWSNTFGDSIYIKKGKEYKNHGEDGYNIFMTEDFGIDEQYIPIIGKTILHHQDHHTQPNLNYQYTTNLSKIDIEKTATGKKELNNAEWQIASLIVQLVADIDKTDILYQHLSDDFDMIRDYVYDRSGAPLDELSKKWEVTKQEIIEYNGITILDEQPKKIKIPVENMPLYKLEVPSYMKEMFYNNSWLELQELINDEHWNFISMLWWRLSHFLNQISFNSTLINIEESKLLEQIYDKIPQKFKPLVSEAFEYAKEIFIQRTIKENEGNIYLKRKNHH